LCVFVRRFIVGGNRTAPQKQGYGAALAVRTSDAT
jgi:hypothetical protein